MTRKSYPRSRTVQAVVVEVIRDRKVAQGTGGVVRLVFQVSNLQKSALAESQLRSHNFVFPSPLFPHLSIHLIYKVLGSSMFKWSARSRNVASDPWLLLSEIDRSFMFNPNPG